MTARGRGAAPLALYGRRLGYELTGLPMAVVSFSLVLAASIAGIVLAFTVIGLPVLAFALRLSTGFATLERRRVGWLEGAVPPAYHRRAAGGFVRQSWEVVKDAQRWRDLVHALVIFPIRLATFLISVIVSAVGLGGVTYLLWEWSLPNDGKRDTSLAELIGLGSSTAADIALTTVLGALCLLAAPFVVWGCAALDAGLAKLLLSDENAELRARVDQLASTRAAAVDAEARTLRRVERDLHDGPQQRLVRLTMDLQSAQRRMVDDPAAASTLVEEALQQAQDALQELRALSRGIAPPILADRGLGAALAAAAARSPVPVELNVELGEPERLPPAVENAVYFLVLEALTNVAKHARATLATVTITTAGPVGGRDDTVVVRITDDGIGGAHVGKGHGLAGLVDRVAAIDGEIVLHSPVGGPTALSAEIPIGTAAR